MEPAAGPPLHYKHGLLGWDGTNGRTYDTPLTVTTSRAPVVPTNLLHPSSTKKILLHPSGSKGNFAL